jgi:hypothetical protein
VSLVISSAIVMLVSSVFLVQNNFYASQLLRTATQDNARSVTELLSADIRMVADSGVIVANESQLVIRSPMLLAVVCGSQGGGSVFAFMEEGTNLVDTLDMGGFAVRDETTGAWSFYQTTWDDIKASGGQPARTCFDTSGSDTTAAAGEFIRLSSLASYHGSLPAPGSMLMLFREIEYRFSASALDTLTMGLYRGNYGETLIEFASGMDTTAAFQYRVSGSPSYTGSVTGAALGTIDGIRVVVQSRLRAATGGRQDVTAGWTVDIPLRNAN